MRKMINSSTWWWMAGLVAVLAIMTPQSLSWLGQRAANFPIKGMSRVANKPSEGGSVQAEANVDSTHPLAPGKYGLETGGKNLKIAHGDPLTIDPEEVYRGLMSLNSAQRDQALETASRFPDALYAFNVIYKRIVELSSDEDPHVAKHARFALSRMMAMRALHEIPEPSEADETDQNAAGTTGAHDPLETEVKPFDTLQEQALDDPAPSVRLGGIEAAMSQRDENIFGLLSEAARGDHDADNWLSAVSELEQMLKSGLGDREQLRGLLEETSTDSDPRVAELSQLIIEEQLDASGLGTESEP
jgi:hypothetical protein